MAAQLDRVEGLLREQSLQLRHLSSKDQLTPSALSRYSGVENASEPKRACVGSQVRVPSTPLSSAYSAPEQDAEPMLIPHGHLAAATAFLALPTVQAVLEQRAARLQTSTACTTPGRFAYSRSYFFDLEATLPLPCPLDLVYATPPGAAGPLWPPAAMAASPPTAMHALAASYFTRVHPSAPLFSATQFHHWAARLSTAQRDAPDDSLETAICLAVLALGSLARPAPPAAAQSEHLALSLILPALRIVWSRALWSLGRASLMLCQALLLMGAYFAYAGRPVHSARMVALASQELLRLMEEYAFFAPPLAVLRPEQH